MRVDKRSVFVAGQAAATPCRAAHRRERPYYHLPERRVQPRVEYRIGHVVQHRYAATGNRLRIVYSNDDEL